MPATDDGRSQTTDRSEEATDALSLARRIVSDYRASAIRRLNALESDLERALARPVPARESTRDIVAEMREMLARAEMLYGEAGVEDLDEIVARSRQRVLDTLGSAAWDRR
jgi:hypothetical protein